MSKFEPVSHTFGPYFDKDSQILILGSLPSVKSRVLRFFYMHPQNRFWPTLNAVFNDEDFISQDIEVKKSALERHHIALYDVIECCEIIGSQDSTIKKVTPADRVINNIINNSKITKIVLAGKKAEKLFNKHIAKFSLNDNIKIMPMPSTSPANAKCSLKLLCEEWKKICE